MALTKRIIITRATHKPKITLTGKIKVQQIIHTTRVTKAKTVREEDIRTITGIIHRSTDTKRKIISGEEDKAEIIRIITANTTITIEITTIITMDSKTNLVIMKELKDKVEE